MTPELIFLAQALIILVLPVAIYRVFRLCGIVPVVVVQIPRRDGTRPGLSRDCTYRPARRCKASPDSSPGDFPWSRERGRIVREAGGPGAPHLASAALPPTDPTVLLCRGVATSKKGLVDLATKPLL